MPPITTPTEHALAVVAGQDYAGYDPVDEAGRLRLVEWAEPVWTSRIDQTLLGVNLDALDVPMAHSTATGRPLVSNGLLGCDLIRVAAGRGFAPHTHPGDHLLVCVGGRGTITYDGKVYPTFAGQVYMVRGEVPHAVGAITDHVILAVGSPHMPVGSPDRMVPVAYREVVVGLGDLSCLVCHREATLPLMLHDVGCVHCPCALCVG